VPEGVRQAESPSAEPLRLLLPSVLCAAAAVFAACVATGPQLYDPGELTAAALALGGSHPPGQTLHALLAHLFFRLPLGPIPARLGLLSALCALGAAWALAELCAELCEALDLRGRYTVALCRTVAALGLLLDEIVLRQSLRIEVYTLSLLLFALSTLQLVRWARHARAAYLWSAALLAGLAACAHPPSGIASLSTAACLALLQPRRLLGRPSVALGAAVAGALALLTLAYLPVRAGAGAPMWGEPRTLAGFLRYLSGQAYLSKAPHGDHIEYARDYLTYLLRVTAFAPALGALFLLRPSGGVRRSVGLGLVLAALIAIAGACVQPLEARNPDNVAYLGPALCLLLATGVAGFASLLQHRLAPLGAVGLACTALPLATLPDLSSHLRADLPMLETLTAALVEAPPARALVVTSSDFTAATWMLARSVDGARPDTALFVSGLSTSSWHWAQLARHPALDGRPLAASGADAHDRYLRGAILKALPHVPVALELDLPGTRPSEVAGGYAVLDPSRVLRGAALDPRSISERLLPTLERDAIRGPAGDAGAAASVVRAYLCRRSWRLLQFGQSQRALAGAALALWDLPAPERALLHSADDRLVGRLPQVLDDPASFEISREDAVRTAAAELWALAERDAARRLLEAQAGRGDPHALLQLALLLGFDGQRADALAVLAHLDQELPGLRREVSAARVALQR